MTTRYTVPIAQILGQAEKIFDDVSRLAATLNDFGHELLFWRAIIRRETPPYQPAFVMVNRPAVFGSHSVLAGTYVFYLLDNKPHIAIGDQSIPIALDDLADDDCCGLVLWKSNE